MPKASGKNAWSRMSDCFVLFHLLFFDFPYFRSKNLRPYDFPFGQNVICLLSVTKILNFPHFLNFFYKICLVKDEQ